MQELKSFFEENYFICDLDAILCLDDCYSLPDEAVSLEPNQISHTQSMVAKKSSHTTLLYQYVS